MTSLNLERIAKQHQRAFPGLPVQQTIAFLGACVDAVHSPPPAAQDAMPIAAQQVPVDLDDDLRQLAEGAPAHIVRELYQAQAERDQRNPNRQGDTMPSNMLRRLRGLSRDQVFERNDDLGTGGPAEYGNGNGNGYDDDPDKGQIDAHTLLHFIELCHNGLLSQDQENGTSEANGFLSGLAEMLAAHAEPNGNGMRNGNGGQDRRARRSARDQFAQGSFAARSPGNGVGAYGDNGLRSRGMAAQDRALAVAVVNRRGFFARFPDAAKVKLSANGRD